MKRITVLLLIFSLFLCACQKEVETKKDPAIHVSEPITEIMYTVAFNKDDCELSKEFDRILGEVMEDGTASRLCETHIEKDLICKEPIPADIEKADDGSLARIREAGKLVIGYHKQHQPMSWIDASSTAVGFDAELAREVGRRMGITIEFRIIEWQRIESALENKEIDAAIGAFEYTEERAKDFNLTRTYLTTSLVLISREDSPIDSIDRLTEEKVGVGEGSYAEVFIADYETEAVTCSSNTNAYKRMKDKSFAAILADETYALYILQGHE